MARPLNEHVYFTSLELENVKCIGDVQKLELTCENGKPARWTLILGENGVGKTTLLQCLARMRPIFDDRPTQELIDPLEFSPEFAREEDNAVFEGLAREGPSTIAKLKATLVSGYNLDGAGGRPNLITSWAEIVRRKGRFASWNNGGKRARGCPEPLVIGYGAGRHARGSNSEAPAAEPTASLFDASIELCDAEKVLHQLDYTVLKRKAAGPRRKLDALKRMLAAILPDVQSPDDIEINPPRGPGGLEGPIGVQVRTPYAQVPLAQLSLGYQTVTAWTVDIALRLIEHYPDSNNPMQEPAIVIVDEIDLHLHPKWQRQIRADLTKHFPNVQFIATAHSPLMAQAYLDAKLVVLKQIDGQVTIENDPYRVQDWRLDQILTSELFGLESSRRPEIGEKIERRVALLQKANLSPEEKEELDALEANVGDFDRWTEDDETALEVVRQTAAAIRAGGNAN